MRLRGEIEAFRDHHRDEHPECSNNPGHSHPGSPARRVLRRPFLHWPAWWDWRRRWWERYFWERVWQALNEHHKREHDHNHEE
jgi:hypothetical protein